MYNLDAAVDDENAALAANDLTYDQDEEGNDIRHRQRRQNDRGRGRAREEGVEEEEEEEDEEDEEEEEDEEGALMPPRAYHQDDFGAQQQHYRLGRDRLPAGLVKLEDLQLNDNVNHLDHQQLSLG